MGRTVEATALEIINKFHAVVMDDGRSKICEIATALEIRIELVQNTLDQSFNKKKLFAR